MKVTISLNVILKSVIMRRLGVSFVIEVIVSLLVSGGTVLPEAGVI